MEDRSGAHQVLLDDPSGAYGEMDAPTREWYCRMADQWSAESGLSPAELARRAIAYAAAARDAGGAGNPAAGHVGYHLVGPGSDAFQEALGLPRSRRARLVQRVFDRHLAGWYVGLLVAAVAVQVGGIAAYATWHGAGLLPVAAAAVLGLPIFCEVAVVLVRALLKSRVRLRVLPRMEFAGGIPDEHRTLVAVPTVVGSAEDGALLLERLERLAAGNADPNLRFALLSDFRDADAQSMPHDAEIVSSLGSAVARLNERYRDGRGDRFFVLHRERRWNAAEGVWMGWERKRGKILELNRLLVGSADTSIRWIFGDLAGACAAAPFRYVITLDDDNGIDPGEAHHLVRTAAHPLNVPWVDPAQGRVVEGYGIVQPVCLPVPEGASRRRTPPPIQSRRARRSFPFDVSGSARYEGKGLYHVAACAEVLDRTFPENRVLDHDQIEGFYARTAYAGDVYVTVSTGSRYHARSLRRHRWIRGYWQHLPWILGRYVRDARGVKRRNPLGLAERFAMLGRLRNNTQGIATFSLLVLGWTILPGNPAVWMLLAYSVLLLQLPATLRGLATRLPARPARPGAVAVPLRSRMAAALNGLQRLAFTSTVLAYEAVVVTDATVRAVYRMTVSRRKLLEWTAQRQVEAGAAAAMPRHLRGLWASPLVALATLGIIVAANREHLLAALPFILLWAAAPWVVARTENRRGVAA